MTSLVGVRHQKNENGDVMLDQDEYIATLRPISSPELTGESPDKLATKNSHGPIR